LITDLFYLLGRVRTLTFVARSSNPAGWNGRGTGIVHVRIDSPEVITFTETGSWRQTAGRELRFHNVFRWSLLSPDRRIRLEHLRFGPAHPVYLFDLAPTDSGEWTSTAAHVCREDCYTARLSAETDHIKIGWTIIGPKKDEDIRYMYSWRVRARILGVS
jgi:hypothetical protein